MTQDTQRRRLGDVLMEWGAINGQQLERALEIQRHSPGRERLGQILLNQHLTDENTLAAALADLHNLRLVDLDAFEIDPVIGRSLDVASARRHRVVPIGASPGLTTVAIADPFDLFTTDELRVRLGTNISRVVAPPSQIDRALDRLWTKVGHQRVINEFVEGLAPVEEKTEVITDDGAVGIINHIVAAASRHRASDIHLEPRTDCVRVRVRIDGSLRELLRLPAAGAGPVTNRVKVLAGMDVFARRTPQDGRVRVQVGDDWIDLRVSTMPSIHGENVVMRLLPKPANLPRLETMGLSWEQVERIQALMSSPQGFLVVAGPTGSGKSTSIYATLAQFSDEARNVISMEDPVEMEMPGITQVQIDEQHGVGFAEGLRAALRQDPDVVVVGEIRDQATARMAVGAALTGHLVLSTLHTLDAPSAAIRLTHMGVERYLVGEALGLVISQRLLRRPCGFCSVPAPVDAQTAQHLGITPEQVGHLVAGTGCVSCEGAGYLGRVGVFEMLTVSPQVRQVILAGGGAPEVAAAGRTAGYLPMREVATRLAVERLTTVDEILRTLPVSPTA